LTNLLKNAFQTENYQSFVEYASRNEKNDL